MRQHEINCVLTGDKEVLYLQCLQNRINAFTTIQIEKCIRESGLSRQEQINVLEQLIKNLKEKQ